MAIKKPLYRKIAHSFVVDKKNYDVQAEVPKTGMNATFPDPKWTYARRDRNGKRVPQAIAHRGYNAQHPENTMGAFMGAVKAGAHALETDTHLSKDGVVVLSHDATLKRCYGEEQKIIDCTWDYLSTLRTLKAPNESMPRLKDLLEYLASPGLEEIWLLLDIKLDNDADDIMRLIARTISQTPPSPHRPWNQRIVLGCWAIKYLPLCTTHLPTFPISHIGFSLPYARQFLTVPNISFNMLQKILLGPFGARFLRDAKALGRPVYVWTVNEDNMMRWSIKNDVDGVITDDPKRFLDVCREWEGGERAVRLGWRQLLSVLWLHLMILVFGFLFRRKFRATIDVRATTGPMKQ